MEDVSGYDCFLCKEFVPGTYSCLAKHLKIVHYMKTSASSRESLICGQNGCQEKFDYFSVFRQHLLVCDKRHINAGGDSQQNNDLENLAAMANDSGHVDMDDTFMQVESHDSMVHEDRSRNDILVPFDITKSMALLFLDLRAKHNVTHAALNFIATNLKKMFVELRKSLNENEHRETKKLVESIIASVSKVGTQHSRTVYFKKYFKLNEADEMDMGSHQQVMRTSRKRSLQSAVPRLISNTFCYISIRRTLSSLFNNKNFRKVYFDEVPSQDGSVHGHRDSSHFKSHQLFSTIVSALRMQISFDDLETTNALGSKTKKDGELSMFTFSILNMPPEFNALLCSIFTFAVCKSYLVRENGFGPILSAFMAEIKILESDEGMLLDIDDLPGFRIKGSIASVCADSKGAHEILGFMSCSAEKLCRLCLISRSEILECKTIGSLTLRNRENYEEAVNRVEATGHKDPNTGVAARCLLNESRYFHVTENIIMDAMHDFLEGVVPFILKLALREFQSTFGITAELLNRRIKLFNYTRTDKSNKPSPKFTNDGLRERGNYNTKQKGAQNWCLIRMFPYLVGDLIPRGNQFFDVVTHLLRIMDIIFLPFIYPAHVPLLMDLIEELFEKFETVFPSVSPINKFHHLVHYVQMMELHGPPMRTWSMRYEGYYNIVKRRAQAIFNFKNLPKSIAEHCNTVLCSNLMDDSFALINQLTMGPCQTFSREEIVERYSLNTVDCNTLSDVATTVSRWIRVGGFEFYPESVVVLAASMASPSGLPSFGVIKTIFIQNDVVFFQVQICETEFFDDHFHGYVITRLCQLQVVALSCLPKFEPLNFLRSFHDDDTTYISARHLI